MGKEASQRFSTRASYYSKARPDYPAEAVEHILQRCQLAEGKELADIGAGTGISSRAFAARGLMVTAVEPNAAMLEQAKAEPAFREKIKFLQAKAEASGLPPGSFDAVLCAQAFHWFDPESALAEFARILKDGGWLALVWNERDESDEFTLSYGNLLRTLPETSKVEMQRGSAGMPLMRSGLFCRQEKKCFANQQVLDRTGLLNRALSASYAPEPGTLQAKSFTKSLESLFAEFQQNSQVIIKYECSVYSGQKTS